MNKYLICFFFNFELKKLIEELQSTSSSSSFTAVLNNQLNQYNDYQQLTPTSSLLNKIEPANLLVQSRIDVEEVCNQIENELVNRLRPLNMTTADHE